MDKKSICGFISSRMHLRHIIQIAIQPSFIEQYICEIWIACNDYIKSTCISFRIQFVPNLELVCFTFQLYDIRNYDKKTVSGIFVSSFFYFREVNPETHSKCELIDIISNSVRTEKKKQIE